MKTLTKALLAVLVAGASLGAHAQPAGFPNKTVRVVVPFAPAGTTDLLGRIAAAHLTEVWGQQFVVDNKSGAGGNVGAEIVAKAPADGYTLLLGTVGTAVTNQYLYKSMPYDSVKSFAPVALISSDGYLMEDSGGGWDATTLKDRGVSMVLTNAWSILSVWTGCTCRYRSEE